MQTPEYDHMDGLTRPAYLAYPEAGKGKVRGALEQVARNVWAMILWPAYQYTASHPEPLPIEQAHYFAEGVDMRKVGDGVELRVPQEYDGTHSCGAVGCLVGNAIFYHWENGDQSPIRIGQHPLSDWPSGSWHAATMHGLTIQHPDLPKRMRALDGLIELCVTLDNLWLDSMPPAQQRRARLAAMRAIGYLTGGWWSVPMDMQVTSFSRTRLRAMQVQAQTDGLSPTLLHDLTDWLIECMAFSYSAYPHVVDYQQEDEQEADDQERWWEDGMDAVPEEGGTSE